MSAQNTIIATRGQRIDDWLEAGGVVIASNERLARALRGSYNRRREAEGVTAWPTPRIFEWKAFVRQQWDAHFADGRMILSPLQEEWLFARIAQNSAVTAATLHGPRMRLASMAREAHELLCSYAPENLDTWNRSAWPGDSDTFHQWLSEFETICEAEGWVSSSRIPLEMTGFLTGDTPSDRETLLLAGFDRLTPTQTRFFEAWGEHEVLAEEKTGEPVREFYAAQDAASELAACALWCRQKLETDPNSRLLVISQDASQRRGEIERAFSRFLNENSTAPAPVEFSMGIPLTHTPLVQGALLILRWISKKPLAENEIDWLLATGLTADTDYETSALQKQMKSIRRRNIQRPEWTLEAFINAKPGGIELPESWTRRMLSALRRIEEAGSRHSAVEWAEILPLCMKDAGWPGSHPMTSANFQALDHWNKTIDTCATLGFDGKPISWPVFHSAVARELDDALFSPESTAASILITGPAQSAGLVADGIWFLGAEEDSWPFSGQPHPFLPLFVQREANMPHSTAQIDADLARSITDRLLHSSPEVNFSYSQLRGKSEANPSHMVVAAAGSPGSLPLELTPDILPVRQTLEYEDKSTVPYGGSKAEGGSSTLTLQSNCAFMAFATARLDAKSWEAAESGLNPRQRGDLVHAVLHSIWGGEARGGWRSSDELKAVLNTNGRDGLAAFVREHVDLAMAALPISVRDRMPERYLAIETERLVKLVTEWLLYESNRGNFTVAGTEQKTPVVIAGLSLDLRLDRRDELEDGSCLIVDYKTGAAAPDRWATERPEDVQLPLYAVFGVNQAPGSEPGGLVFARVKAGELEFAGRLRNPLAVLPGAGKTSSLVKNPLTDDQLSEWRWTIERLAMDFLAGKAEVNPRDLDDTCEHCKLSTLCRIKERREVAA
jgi:ATP-dependent helicase/nuclease subunit B